MRSPYPLTGKLADVTLDGHELMIVKGHYTDSEAERLGEHITQGDPSYGDFNPYESAEVAAQFDGHFGLSRYSDLEDSAAAHKMIYDSVDADAGDGYIIMSGKRTPESLPGATAPCVFLSEITASSGTRSFIAIAGRKLFTRNSSGVWADSGVTLAATPLQQAITIFGHYVILGYGSAANAEYLDIDTLAHAPIEQAPSTDAMFVFAATSDHNSVYVAAYGIGGAGSGNLIWSSVDGISYPTSSATTVIPYPLSCTGLAPGGGAATIFYSWPGGIGMVGLDGTVRTLMTFDWPDPENGKGLGWWQGHGDDPQRGPLLLHFRRDNDPYVYSPASQGTGTAGTAINISPWAAQGMRPFLTYGVPTAWFGTARYLFFAVTRSDGHTFILKQDSRTSVVGGYWDMGVEPCYAMAMTGIFNSQPLFFAAGSAGVVFSTPWPRAGGSPLNDDNCRYEATGLVYLPGADLGLPDETKIEFSVRVQADNLAESVRYVEIGYVLDQDAADGGWIALGQATESPVSEITFDDPPSDHYIHLRATVHNTDDTSTPVIKAITLRRSLNPKLYRWWEFDAIVPAGEGQFADDLQNPYTLRARLWLARVRGTPVTFRDLDGDTHLVRIMKMRFTLQERAHHMSPAWIASITLLQTSALTAISIPAVFLAPSSSTGASWPVPSPVGPVGLYSSYMNDTGTVTNPTDADIYPVWTVTGPAGYIGLTNNETGQLWEWNGTIGLGAMLTIDFRPSKHTVLDHDRVDYSSDVSVSSEWWPFLPGDNSISVIVAGTSEETQVSVTALA